MRLFLVPLLLCLSLPACAADCLPEVKEGWIRLVPGGMPMNAGFARIENRCKAPATLVSADSPAYAGVELHETTLVDGVSRMRRIEQLRIEAGKDAVLQPGGLHLMLMRPAKPLQAGERVPLEFRLQDGRSLHVEFEVRAPGA